MLTKVAVSVHWTNTENTKLVTFPFKTDREAQKSSAKKAFISGKS